MRQNVFLLLLVAFIGCYSDLVQADHAIGMTMTGFQRTPTDSPTTNRGLRSGALATTETTETTATADDEERLFKFPVLSKWRTLFRKNPTTSISTLRKDPKIIEQLQTLQKHPKVMEKIEGVKEIPVVQKNLKNLQSNRELMKSLQNGAPEKSIKEVSTYLSRGMSEKTAANRKGALFFLSIFVMFGVIIGVAAIASNAGKK